MFDYLYACSIPVDLHENWLHYFCDGNVVQDKNEESNRSWTIQDEILSAIKKYKNKYAVLEEEEINKDRELKQLKDIMIVDQYLNMKMQPTSYEAQNWSKDMVNYFKLKWEEDGMKDKESMQEDIEDVMEGENISAKMCSANEISGMETAVKCYCSFIYAANCGIKRRKLWNELKTASNIVSNKPWIMLGDFNVTMKVEEHSSGGSQVSSEMQDLIDCANEVEMEDINSTGFFMSSFNEAYGQFMPFLTSDHSAAEEFLPTMEKEWSQNIVGHTMYKVVKILKAIKQFMRKLNWKNGDFIERVELCRHSLKAVQKDMVQNPHNDSIKAKEVECLAEYLAALNDEEKSLNMVTNVNDKEIKEALFDIGENRDPGPDGYNCKNKPSRCSLKIDIAKAYDIVDWDFLRNIRVNFGFYKKISGRGLRQGDPLSPYLFTLIMEVFSLMLARKVNENKKFKFHKGYKETQLTHLSFVDDLLVLCHGDEVSVKVIKEALMEFSNWNNMGRDKVAWKEVYRSKKEGGLGLKHLGDWKVLLRKSFWVIDEEAGDSGTWKALLELRDEIKPKIIHEIGNSIKVSIWNDNWSDMGYLNQLVTYKDIHDARINENCSVVDMIKDNKWIWPEQ
ncbi:RNA-directed DNA polymerase, eukaryota, reverse transcriptase zinc-binding domain protein [Tanacetum coccineum]